MNKKAQQYLDYLQVTIHPILEKLVLDLILAKPQDPIFFMINWLIRSKQLEEQKKIKESQKSQKSTQNIQSSVYNEISSRIFTFNQSDIATSTKLTPIMKKSCNSDIPKIKPSSNQIKLKKSTGQIEKIKQRIKKTLMFTSLDDIEISILINAMEEKKIKAGQYVIKQFEIQHEFYIVQSGELDCYRIENQKSEQVYLKTYVSGESFGELSLLYNVPRQATIISRTDSILWSIDKETYINVLRDSTIQKREKYKKFITSVEILARLDPYLKNRISDYFIQMKLPEKRKITSIFLQKSVYFVHTGEIAGERKLKQGKSEPLIFKKGDIFGDINILNQFMKTLELSTTTPCTLLKLEKQIFNSLIGDSNQYLIAKILSYTTSQKKRDSVQK